MLNSKLTTEKNDISGESGVIRSILLAKEAPEALLLPAHCILFSVIYVQ